MSGRKHKCPGCGQQALRRIERIGFLKKHVYPIFGFYPWECPQCRRKLLVHSRGKRELYARSAPHRAAAPLTSEDAAVRSTPNSPNIRISRS